MAMNNEYVYFRAAGRNFLKQFGIISIIYSIGLPLLKVTSEIYGTVPSTIYKTIVYIVEEAEAHSIFEAIFVNIHSFLASRIFRIIRCSCLLIDEILNR